MNQLTKKILEKKHLSPCVQIGTSGPQPVTLFQGPHIHLSVQSNCNSLVVPGVTLLSIDLVADANPVLQTHLPKLGARVCALVISPTAD